MAKSKSKQNSTPMSAEEKLASEFIDDIDRDLQEQKLFNFIKKWGALIVVLIIAFVAYVFVSQYLQNSQIEKNSNVVAMLQQIKEDGNLSDKQVIDDLLAKDFIDDEHRLFISQAYINSIGTDNVDAKSIVSAFNDIKSVSIDESFIDYAAITTAARLIEFDEFSALESDMLRLSDDAVFGNLAKEILAMRNIHLENFEVAKELLSSILASQSANANMLFRVEFMLSELSEKINN